MPHEHEELVRRIYAAWNEGETEGLDRFFSEDFEYSTSGHFPGFEPVYKGPEGILRFYEEMLSAWESFRIELRSLEPRGDGLLASVHFAARGHASGIVVELDFFHALRFSDGKVCRLAASASPEAALEAGGLEE